MPKDLLLALGIPDTHRPFHDRKAYNLMLEVAAYLMPDEVFLYGDYADMYNVTSHAKDRSIRVDLESEIKDVNEGLDQLDDLFPDAKKYFIEGNHEYRFERYLNEKAPELFGITDIQLLLQMPSRPRWTWHSYRPDQAHKVLGSPLIARHEPMPQSGDPQAVIRNMMTSVTFGHVHRIREAYAVTLEGDQHVAFSPGWLGNKHHPVMRYVKGYWQWQLGFVLVWVDPHTKRFYHQIIAIHEDYSCHVHGKRFKA